MASVKRQPAEKLLIDVGYTLVTWGGQGLNILRLKKISSEERKERELKLS